MKNLTMFHLLSLSAILAIAPLASAQLPIAAGSIAPVAAGLNDPRGLAFGPDGALYIAEAGIGGTTSTVGTCAQVLPPVGPDKGGPSGRISRLSPGGKLSIVATGFPSFAAAQGDMIGVADVAFLDGELYALIGGGGCSHGNPTQPNGIAKVNTKTSRWNYIADLSIFYQQHPGAYTNVADFEPDGVPYSMIAEDGRLLVVESNHGTITSTTPDGRTKQLFDMSFPFGHIVPTSIAATENDLYIGNLGLFPITSQWERVTVLSRKVEFFDPAPGLSTKPAAFHLVNSRAGFTTVVALKFGPDGLLYALELSDTPGGFPNPGDGKVERINRDGQIETVVTGLTLPGSMVFGPDRALYISNNGDLGPGKGEILRIDIPM